MLVSGVQHSDSVIHIHTHSFSDSFPFHYRLLQDIDCSSLCYIQVLVVKKSIFSAHKLENEEEPKRKKKFGGPEIRLPELTTVGNFACVLLNHLYFFFFNLFLFIFFNKYFN